MTELHEPDPDFTRFLEWQTRTELRRAERFSADPDPVAEPQTMRRPGRLLRFARAAAVVLFSISAGASGVLAAQGVQRSKAAERLLAANRIETTLAERRVEAFTQALEMAKQLYDTGFTPVGVVDEQTLRLNHATIEQRRLTFNREEIELTAAAPDDSIAAPMVDGRDFVRERLLLDVEAATADVAFTSSRLDSVQQLVQIGWASPMEQYEVEGPAKTAALELDRLTNAVALRARFTGGGLEAAEVRRLHQLAEVDGAIAVAQAERDALATKVEHVEQMMALGQAQPSELAPLTTELLELDARLELLALERELHEAE